MKYYYIGKKTQPTIKEQISYIFMKMQIQKTENIADIIEKIRELDVKNTPIGRGVLNTDSNVIPHIYEYITIYDISNDTITGVVTFFIQNKDICIETLCSPFIPIAKGIPTKLLNDVKKIMKIINLDQIILSSKRTSVEFYRKNGFLEDHSVSSHFPDYPLVDMIFSTGF